MDSDGDIARAARLMPIAAIGEKLGIPADALIPYGHTKAKLSGDFLRQLKDRPDGDLVLVTAMYPTPAGEGKTTTTVGLGDALTRLGKRTVIALREPSLGPCFGQKGGATGGGVWKTTDGGETWRPITDGHVNALATARHRGATTWIWDVELSDDEGRVCALSRMTIAVRQMRG